MNLKKEIFERISAIEKVELSETKKIELALVDDFEKEYKSALDAQEKALAAIVDYNELGTKIINTLNQSGQIFLKANARFQEIEQMTKELGIEVSPVLKNKKDIISISLKEIDAYNKKLASNKISL
jgi:DNA repair ATPase RecN